MIYAQDDNHDVDRPICLIHNGSREAISITIGIAGPPRSIEIAPGGFLAIPIDPAAAIPTVSILASGIDGIPFPHTIPLTSWIQRREIGLRGWLARALRQIHQPPPPSYRIGILEWNGDITGARLIT